MSYIPHYFLCNHSIMEANLCHVPVSIGELFDKYTILQIKKERITQEHKLIMVEKELAYLKTYIDKYLIEPSTYFVVAQACSKHELVDELKEINEELWVIEDKIREKERRCEFDEEFIGLARRVYITNDKRSETKNKINSILKSELMDIKSYSQY